MSALLTSLFSNRRRRTTSRASSPRRRLRLGVESLGERIVPAVTSSLVNGLLTVTGDGVKDNNVLVFLWKESNGRQDTVVFDEVANQKSYYASSSVTRLEMKGGNGKNILENDTFFPSTMTGGNSDDTLIGGWGSDIFNGTSGRDTYTGRDGQDVLYRNGFHGVIADSASRPTDYDLTVGQVSNPSNPTVAFTASELSAQGSITASLDPANSRRLILNGPSGAAIVLKSNWSHNVADQDFEATSSIKMETLTGDVTLWPAVPGAKTQVKLYGSPVSDAGNLYQIDWAGQTVTRGASPLQDMLDDVTSPLGVTIGIPNANWGIGLGSEVRSLDGDAPLNDAVPYIYAGFDAGLSINSTNASISLPGTKSATFAYAPSDGTEYVGVGDKGFAVSPYGYIPYQPTNRPTGVKDPSIWGHVYVRGTIPLTSNLSVDGSIVLDLDYNADGVSSALNATSLSNAFGAFSHISDGSGLNSAGKAALAALNDTAIGFNGTLSVGFKDVVTLQLGSASAWYRPGQIAMAADSSNPFSGLEVLEKLDGTSYHLQGVCNWTPGSSAAPTWSIDTSAATASFGGLSGTDLSLHAGSDTKGITASATYSIPVLGTMTAKGTIGFDGSFQLDGSIVSSQHIDKDHSYRHTDVTTSISIGYANHDFTFAGHFHAAGTYESDALGAAGFSVDVALTVTVLAPYGGPGKIYVSGEGSIDGWANPLWAGVIDVSIGFAFDNNSFTLDLPVIGDVTIDW